MPSAKTQRRAERRFLHNRPIRTQTRTLVTKAKRLIQTKEIDQSEVAVREAISALDRASSKGVLHANNSSRRKSRLMKAFANTTPPSVESLPNASPAARSRRKSSS